MEEGREKKLRMGDEWGGVRGILLRGVFLYRVGEV